MSRVRRRSGNAVTEYCKLIGFEPNTVIIAGVGLNHVETDVIQEVWSQTTIIGFEPNPQTFNQILKSFPGTLHPFALWDKSGVGVALHYANRHRDGGSVFVRNEANQRDDLQTSMVSARRLDDVLTGNWGKSLLWLDCEGAEYQAIQGGQSSITRSVDVINVELTGNTRVQNPKTPLDVHRFLVGLGFYQVWTHTHRSVLGQFDAIYVRKELVNPKFCSCLETLNAIEK